MNGTFMKIVSIVQIVVGSGLVVASFYHYSVLKKQVPHGKAVVRYLQIIMPGLTSLFIGIVGVDLYPNLDFYEIPLMITALLQGASLVLVFLAALVFYEHYVLSDDAVNPTQEEEEDGTVE